MAIGVGELIVLGVLAAGGVGAYLPLTLLAPARERRRVAVLGLLLFGPALTFGLGAALTPPDVMTTLVWAVPLGLICAAVLGLLLLARGARRG